MNKPTAGHVDDTIESIVKLEQRAEDNASCHQRWIERVTGRIGRPHAVYILIGFIALWIGVNMVLPITHRAAFDPPPFHWLQGMLSFTAVLMMVLALTAESRISQIDVRLNRLDLQINLLTERKVTKVIDMLDTLRRDLPSIPTHDDPEVNELREHMDPQDVVQAIETQAPSRLGGK